MAISGNPFNPSSLSDFEPIGKRSQNPIGAGLRIHTRPAQDPRLGNHLSVLSRLYALTPKDRGLARCNGTSPVVAPPDGGML